MKFITLLNVKGWDMGWGEGGQECLLQTVTNGGEGSKNVKLSVSTLPKRV